ncbi:hypothetical protein SCUP234_05368 [Seiridium cupressi]
MKFIAILTLATTALAVPSTLERDPKQECTPPSYACKPNNSGWLVCNVDGKWLRERETEEEEEEDCEIASSFVAP